MRRLAWKNSPRPVRLMLAATLLLSGCSKDIPLISSGTKPAPPAATSTAKDGSKEAAGAGGVVMAPLPAAPPVPPPPVIRSEALPPPPAAGAGGPTAGTGTGGPGMPAIPATPDQVAPLPSPPGAMTPPGATLSPPGTPAAGTAPVLTPPPGLRSGPTQIALLLPLSGPQAALGNALFNAAQLALFELGDESFTLLPFDSKGTPEGAQAATQAALNQHPDLIIGPLFAAEARVAAALTRPAGVPLLSFTTDKTVAGDGVFALGFLPGPQAVQVVRFARSQNYGRVAVLAPANDYGRRVAEAVQADPALSAGIVAVQFYDPLLPDPIAAVRSIARSDPRRPGDPGFDALLIPDEGSRLRGLVAALPTAGVNRAQIRLLGTMLWDDGKITQEPLLSGGWFVAPPASSRSDFESRYQRAFSAKPPRLAGLAYDATALAAILARKAPHNFTVPVLTEPTGFAGTDGLFRLLPDGGNERGYAIEEVQGSGLPPRDAVPAPASFDPPVGGGLVPPGAAAAPR